MSYSHKLSIDIVIWNWELIAWDVIVDKLMII